MDFIFSLYSKPEEKKIERANARGMTKTSKKLSKIEKNGQKLQKIEEKKLAKNKNEKICKEM